MSVLDAYRNGEPEKLLARIAELEAEVEGAGFENRRLLTRFHRAEAALAERDQLVILFEDMWANVTEDHVAESVFHKYNELMDRWAARAENPDA